MSRRGIRRLGWLSFPWFLIQRGRCKVFGHLSPKEFAAYGPGQVVVVGVCRRCYEPLKKADYRGQYPRPRR